MTSQGSVQARFQRAETATSDIYPAVRYALALLGQMGVEGDVVTWVADHRKHHQFSDREGDPHSPHADFGEGSG